jgi:ribosomal protein S18 acetylase RimI-like enzyme
MKRIDVKAMKALNESSMPEHYESRFWTYVYNQAGDMCFVAKSEGRLVGYILCKQERVQGIPVGIVISVAVDSNWRGQGMGRELMREAHRAMRKRGLLMSTLQVRKSNLTAINMYERLGYTQDMTVPHYYSNPSEDGYLMTLVF